MSRKNIGLMVVIAVTMFIAVLHVFIFAKELNQKITENIYAQLSEVSSQTIISIHAHLNEQLASLSIMSNHLSRMEDLQSETVYLMLADAVRNKGFLRVSVNFPDGSRITHDKIMGSNVSGQEYFIRSMGGEKVIVGPTQSIANPEKVVIVLAVPIYKDGKVIASLSATYDTDNLDKLFNLSFLNNNGYMFIAQSNGTVITNVPSNLHLNKGDNFLDYIRQRCEHQEHYPVVKAQIENGQDSANFIEHTDGEITYINFTKIGISDWYMFTLAHDTVMQEQVLGIEMAVANLGLVLALCVLALCSFIVYTQVSARNTALLNARCFHVLAEQSGNVIFEWDFAKDRINSLSNFKELFGREAITKNSPNEAINAGVIHEDDTAVFAQIFTDIQNGKNVDKVKFRIKDISGSFHWCSLSGVVIKGRNGKPFKAIGSLDNIDKHERETAELRMKASLDVLTGLYNKATTERLVSSILAASCDRNLHAMISADLDNFKNINDSFGHLYGDTVLKEIADDMRTLFRSTDILGRFGGDEFVLFIRDVPNIQFIEDKANEFIEKFDKVYRVGEVEHKITISIGIAFFPYDGRTYEHLYQNADEALYMAKRAGKNMYFLKTQKGSEEKIH